MAGLNQNKKYQQFINQVMKMKNIIAICLAALISADASARKKEKDYQAEWCNGVGRIEVVLADRTRVDCLTETHAIEFDFAKSSKWAESIGQSLHYARMTGKRAGIVLIVTKESDSKDVDRVKMIIDHFGLPIDLCAHDDVCPGMKIYFKSLIN